MKRNIIKIEIDTIDKYECKVLVYLECNRFDRVIIKKSDYSLFNSLRCSDFLNINLNYYDDLGAREKNILDNLSLIKKSKEIRGAWVFSSTDAKIFNQNEAFVILNDKVIA